MNISDLTRKHDFHFAKKYGQNFIGDEALLESIVDDARIDKDDVVLEIGAGAGTLTRRIANRAKNVTSFEIDTRLKPILQETVMSNCNNVEIVYGDVMDFSDDDIYSLVGDNFAIVANLPYYITTPILFKFLSGNLKIKSITVMVQKEVAERICAQPKTKDYGALTVSVGLRGKAEITQIVLRDKFTPPPEVDSAIVHIEVKENENVQDWARMDRLVKCAFAMKRKTLTNNLVSFFNKSKSQIGEILQSLNIPTSARAEELSIDQFVALCNYKD